MTVVLSHTILFAFLVQTCRGAASSQALCNASTSDWQPNIAAFNAANTSAQLTSWWAPIQSKGIRFDTALGREFGNDDFSCGIAATDCLITTCSGVEAWVYQSAGSAGHLDEFFNNIYEGISLSQEDTTELTSNLADQLFGWTDPTWALGEALLWGGFALTMLFAWAGPVGQFISSASSTVRQQVTDSFAPQAGLTRDQGIDALNTMFDNFSTSARASMEQFVNNTFAGIPDSNNKTVVDYIKTGGFVTAQSIPPLSETENLFKAVLLSKAVNEYWSASTNYLVSTTAYINSTYSAYPKNASWFSASSNRTYAPYYYDESTPQQPTGLNLLNGTLYNITAAQVAQSAGAAWEYAGNNYTADIATQRLNDAFSNASLTPFQDGAGWEGIFTLPVCDVQDHLEWMAPYGGTDLPCCCGVNCSDTKAWIQQANLNMSLSWYDTCKTQLAGTDVDFFQIDYGIPTGSAAQHFWDSMSTVKQTFFIFGVLAGLLLVLWLLSLIIVWCSE